VPYWNRTQEELKSFFDGLELVEPGFVSVPRWRPDGIRAVGEEPAFLDHFGGVARKP
jgi:hypothetical protein